MKESALANGVTLDLRKCFNLIFRPRVKTILLEMGFPSVLVHKWFFKLKPAFPSQGQVFDLLSGHFSNNNSWLGGLPANSFNVVFLPWECDVSAGRIPWTNRAQKANARMKAVRTQWFCFSFFGHLLLPNREEASGFLLAVGRGPLAKVKVLNSG